jgi:c-di-GMP-binding flagellar brake protein YcgR
MRAGQRTAMTKTNRRAFPRFSTPFAICVITDRATVPAEPLELSEGGLSYRSTDSLKVGEQLTVEFKLEDSSEWIRVKCAVRHAEQGRVGVEFLNLRRQDRLKIIDVISATTP